MALRIRHIKGYAGRLAGSLCAHPATRGMLCYPVGAQLIVCLEGDVTKQVSLRGHDDAISAFAMSRTGALLASGQQGRNSDVVVWDTARMAQKFRFEEHDEEVCALGFSADERLLATVGNERERRLFVLDTQTGKIVTNCQLLEPKRTTALAWSPAPGPCYLFATAADMDVFLYDVDPFKGWVHCEKVTTGSVRRSITSLCFSLDGAWLFAGTASGDVLTINIARRAVQLMHPVASGGVGALTLTPGGKVLVGACDGSISLFDFQQQSHNGPPLACVPGPISSLSMADSGTALLVGTLHGDIFSLPASPALAASGSSHGPAPGASSRAAQVQAQALMQSQPGAIVDLSWAADASGSLATASLEGTVCVWRSTTLELECRVALHTGAAAQSVAASRELVLSGWNDGVLRCHSRAPAAPGREQGRELWVIPSAHATAHASGIPALQLSNRGHFVASGGAGGEVRVWDLASREMVAHLKHHSQPITDLKVTIDDSHILAASEDRTWSIFDISREKASQVFRATMGAVRGVAMAPDQVSVVSVGLDRGVFVWDVRKETPVRVIPNAHLHEITCCAINNRGNLIATGGADCAVKLWDWGSGRQLGAYAGHSATVNSIAFSPCDNQATSAASDGSLVLWRVDQQEQA